MNKTELLDLKVYGKGMTTHIEAKSELIGAWAEQNAKTNYGEKTLVRCPLSIITHHGDSSQVQVMHLSIMDTRYGDSGTEYGYAAASQRGSNFLMPFERYGMSSVPNNTLFMIPGLATGLHLVLPQFVGKDCVEKYVQGIREEAAFVFKTWLMPSSRRLRMYVEEWKNE